jgi:hypothetical protein
MRGQGVCFDYIRVHRVPFSCKELRKYAISEISYKSIELATAVPKFNLSSFEFLQFESGCEG